MRDFFTCRDDQPCFHSFHVIRHGPFEEHHFLRALFQLLCELVRDPVAMLTAWTVQLSKAFAYVLC